MPLTQQRPVELLSTIGSSHSQGYNSSTSSYNYASGMSTFGHGTSSPHGQYNLHTASATQGARSGALRNLQVCMDHFSATLEYPSGGMHHFVNLLGNQHFLDPGMESIDMMQLDDKFPQLRHEYAHGPANSFFLVKFWADMTHDICTYPGFYAHTARFHSIIKMPFMLTTRLFSLGKEVVSKDQFASPVADNTTGGFLYLFERSAMCPYLVSFIERLRMLDNREHMNRVLEGFSVVQTVRNGNTGEILFSTAFMFDVAMPGLGTRTQVFKLFDSASDVARRYTA